MDDKEAARQAAFSRTMVSMTFLLDVMGLFAAPRWAAKLGRVPTQECMLKHLDAYLVVSPHMTAPIGHAPRPDTTPYALRLRELFSAWTPSVEVPQEVVQAAREFLAAFGITGPDEGWDDFAGFPDDPPPDQIDW